MIIFNNVAFWLRFQSSIIGFDEWEETQDPKLHLEILDADVFSSDDMIGEAVNTARLSRIQLRLWLDVHDFLICLLYLLRS